MSDIKEADFDLADGELKEELAMIEHLNQER
jgi:hypothetical protein